METRTQSWVFGCDHAGFPARGQILPILRSLGDVSDQGCPSLDPVDYPDVAARVVGCLYDLWDQKQQAFGVLICGSGQGMAMAANRFTRVRAALCRTIEDVRLARHHNDANVLVMGARITSNYDQIACLKAFAHPHVIEDRHLLRLRKLEALPY